MKWLSCCFVLFFSAAAFSQLSKPEQTRFFKAECGTAADYLELAKDGTYRIIDREHMGVSVIQHGRWEQKGAVITFKPESVLRGGEMVSAENRTYEGTEQTYKNKVFITFDKENAAEIVIPLADITHELDSDPRSVPLYVLFKTNAQVFENETKQTYPFRYIKPNVKTK